MLSSGPKKGPTHLDHEHHVGYMSKWAEVGQFIKIYSFEILILKLLKYSGVTYQEVSVWQERNM